MLTYFEVNLSIFKFLVWLLADLKLFVTYTFSVLGISKDVVSLAQYQCGQLGWVLLCSKKCCAVPVHVCLLFAFGSHGVQLSPLVPTDLRAAFNKSRHLQEDYL